MKVYEFTEEEIESIANLKTRKNLKRFTDRSVIWKARDLRCPLLTGDRKMKEEAKEMGIEVHGSIWVVDEIVRKTEPSREMAVSYYQKLRDTNKRLPADKIEKKIRELK